MTSIVSNFTNHSTCPECNSHVISESKMAQNTCINCGLVISERGIHENGTGLKCPEVYHPYRGYTKPKMCQELVRALRRTGYQKTNKERYFNRANYHIDMVASQLRLPYSIIKQVRFLYEQVYELKLTRGRTIPGVISAITLYCCKKAGIPYSFNDFLLYITEKRKGFYKIYKTLVRKMNLPHLNSQKLYLNLISKVCSELGVLDIEKRVIEEYKKIPHAYIVGKNPRGFIAALIYVNTVKKITQKVISEKVGISEIILRVRVKEIKKVS